MGARLKSIYHNVPPEYAYILFFIGKLCHTVYPSITKFGTHSYYTLLHVCCKFYLQHTNIFVYI